MTAGGEIQEQTLQVREDPRIDVDALVRREWTEMLLDVWDVTAEAQSLSRSVGDVAERLDADDDRLAVGARVELRSPVHARHV